MELPDTFLVCCLLYLCIPFYWSQRNVNVNINIVDVNYLLDRLIKLVLYYHCYCLSLNGYHNRLNELFDAEDPFPDLQVTVWSNSILLTSIDRRRTTFSNQLRNSDKIVSNYFYPMVVSKIESRVSFKQIFNKVQKCLKSL